jgi:hypothetical protein
MYIIQMQLFVDIGTDGRVRGSNRGLTLMMSTKEDDGTYTCEVQYQGETQTATFRVTFYGKAHVRYINTLAIMFK